MKIPQTKVGLKRKFRNDMSSEPYKIQVISPQNVELVLKEN
jgi:hypothetical protein